MQKLSIMIGLVVVIGAAIAFYSVAKQETREEFTEKPARSEVESASLQQDPATQISRESGKTRNPSPNSNSVVDRALKPTTVKFQAIDTNNEPVGGITIRCPALGKDAAPTKGDGIATFAILGIERELLKNQGDLSAHLVGLFAPLPSTVFSLKDNSALPIQIHVPDHGFVACSWNVHSKTNTLSMFDQGNTTHKNQDANHSDDAPAILVPRFLECRSPFVSLIQRRIIPRRCARLFVLEALENGSSSSFFRQEFLHDIGHGRVVSGVEDLDCTWDDILCFRHSWIRFDLISFTDLTRRSTKNEGLSDSTPSTHSRSDEGR